jgi:hypothetical protein
MDKVFSQLKLLLQYGEAEELLKDLNLITIKEPSGPTKRLIDVLTGIRRSEEEGRKLGTYT